jgi:hypothetical protein
MACELRGGTPKTDALPTPADWLAIYREQLSEKNLHIAELEVALREVVDAWNTAELEGRDPMVPAIDNAEAVLRKYEQK